MSPDPGQPDATWTAPAAPASTPAAAAAPLPPGAMIAQRYRIVSRLGRGGMGEVYRADDLLLGQPVALKFLPDEWAGDPQTVERFRNEVRTARLVSHPNVCRVHDLGEAGGHLFLTMEFVDGEDLASLLRRIGRLPEDKALDIARKLCAGLQSAHNKGVIHRDLKPANIMIDGRGEVAITDFGLAGIAGSIEDAGSGTPGYMAPEQRERREVTSRSDLYSLGLVLHEVFTGRRPDAVSSSSATTPMLDPIVAGVIRHCMAEDPAARPRSARAIALALPGGDPVAAAIAAGETPSPEAVAASGDRATMKPAHALALAVLALTGPVCAAWLAGRSGAAALTDPAELRVRARDLIRNLAGDASGEETSGVTERYSFNEYLGDEPARRWYFWLRTSPVPFGALRTKPTPSIDEDSPPPDRPGMTRVRLDFSGRLVSYDRVPDDAPPPAAAPDWNELLRLAGIDPAQATEIDAPGGRRAWTVSAGGIRYDVTARNANGRVESFAVKGPWDADPGLPSPWPWRIESVAAIAAFALAWRNYRLGRTDLRAAGVVFVLIFLGGAVRTFLTGASLLHWNSDFTPLDSIAPILIVAVLFGAAYLAVEPFVRRRLPAALATWTRLMHGHWRDATIARDVLMGMAVTSAVGALLFSLSPDSNGALRRVDLVANLPALAASLADVFSAALRRAVMVTFLYFLFRLVLRRDWATAIAFIVFFVAMLAGQSGTRAPQALAVFALIGAKQVFLLLRFGFLSLIAGEVVPIVTMFVFTLDTGSWLAGPSYLALAFVAAIVAVAFRNATAGRSFDWGEAG
ncbi:MAG: serine/threonine-protein kinase [Bryobacteraceae bacterium]